ncbi:DUF6136 family protein [uncultured Paraglaciecola sp.]|uniref:DUF6136 family protein n=1 Tax=uncultured Paraglaciecola sp. TaxID=1765024 RepID=UPI0030DC30B7|tara:strand:- start:563578 stop:564702 length:1125 start_codon:yes stop_codon:yes gene_type:complete
MNYWQFRLRLYNESLKQWVDSIRQLSMGLVALFPLAIPALIFLPFVTWGILADAGSENTLYLNTLWGYLLFLYTWMLMQRQGILATQHSHYLDSLVVTNVKRQWCETGLIIYSANILLLGPLCLLLLMVYEGSNRLLRFPISHSVEQFVPILGLVALVSYYSVSAVRVPKLPWLSLLLLPLVAIGMADEFEKAQWLVLWCVAIIIERHLPKPSVSLGAWPKGFFRLQLQADLHNPRSEGLRFVSLLLMTILLSIMYQGVKHEAQSYVAGFLCFCAALLMASSLFDSQALLRLYHSYFVSLPISRYVLQSHCLLYVAVKALPGLLLLSYFEVFSWMHWGLWLVFYVTSLVGIFYRPKWFFMFPIIAAIMVFLLLS